MGYRTHFKWLDSHFISPTLKGCFVIFIPHNTSCGCGGGIWSQTKLPQALAFLLALGAYPHNRLMRFNNPFDAPTFWRRRRVSISLVVSLRPNGFRNRPLCQHWVRLHMNDQSTSSFRISRRIFRMIFAFTTGSRCFRRLIRARSISTVLVIVLYLRC